MSPTIPAGKKPPALTTLPSEIVFEILTRLPGKPVARSKVVCKAWLSMIRSGPFRKAYRSRQRGLVLHWCEDIVSSMPRRSHTDPDRRILFYYSPLRRLNELPPEDFRPFLQFDLSSWYDGATQVVNGLVCYREKMSSTVTELTLYSIFTGEKMKVPDPEVVFGRFEETESIFHLGYDPMTGEYKIMRLIFQCDREGIVGNLPLRLHTIVLRRSDSYSDSESAWRWITYKDTGLADLRLPSKAVYELVSGHEARTFSGDGVVCWFRQKEGLIWFDFHEERFRRVKLPEGLEHEKRVFVRGSFDGSTSLALYVLPLDGNNPECFVLDDFKDGRWRKETVEFPEDIREISGGLAVAGGDEMLLLMGNQENISRFVYSYGDDKSVKRFMVGNLPNKPLDLDGKCKPWDCYSKFKCKPWDCYSKFDARLSYLHDSTVLYRSINDVLSHANVCECCGNDFENVDSVAAS